MYFCMITVLGTSSVICGEKKIMIKQKRKSEHTEDMKNFTDIFILLKNRKQNKLFRLILYFAKSGKKLRIQKFQQK